MLVPLFAWSAIHAVIAALTFFGSAAFWIIWKLHKRLRRLESGGDEVERAVFGKSNNPLHVGLTREVSEIQQDVRELQKMVDEAESDRNELKRRLEVVQQKVERLLNQINE